MVSLRGAQNVQNSTIFFTEALMDRRFFSALDMENWNLLNKRIEVFFLD